MYTMSMDKLRHFLETIIELDDDEWLGISKQCTCTTHSKGESLNYLTDTRKIAFIFSGVVRSYVVEVDGKDYTWNFHYSGNDAKINNLFVVDYMSLLTGEKAVLNFDVLEECEVVSLPYEVLLSLSAQYEKWQRYCRIVTEEAYLITRERTLTLLCKSASQRLNILKDNFPDIFEKIPDYYIASYLGIAPQTLSRLQNK